MLRDHQSELPFVPPLGTKAHDGASPLHELQESIERSQNSDVFFVIGSSLVVTPAANMPGIAKQNGAKLIIINKGETPYDDLTDIRFDNKIEDVLPPIMEKVRKMVNKI